MCALASFSTYFSSTFVDQEGFVGAFDSVVTQEALVDRVVESFNDDFDAMSAKAIEDGRVNVDTIDFDAIGIPTTDDDGDDVEPEELLDQLRDLQRVTVREAVDNAVNRPDFPEIFSTALGEAHGDLIDALDIDLQGDEPRETDGEMFLSLQGTYDRILRTLENDPATAEVAAAVGAEEIGQLKIGDRTTTTERLWGFARYARDNAALLVVLAALSLALSVAVAERRPQALISAGLGMMLVAALILVFMYGLWMVVPLLTEGRTSGSLVATVYEHALRPLLRLEIAMAVLGLAIAAVGWLTRWIWPDDWVYSYYDDGAGIKSVARRATRSERLGRQPQGPVPVHASPDAAGPHLPQRPQPVPGYPQPGYPQPGYPTAAPQLGPAPQQGWSAPAAGWAPAPQPPAWQQQQGWPYAAAGDATSTNGAAHGAPPPTFDRTLPEHVPDWDPTETRDWNPDSDGWDVSETYPAPPALPAAGESSGADPDWDDNSGWGEPFFGEVAEDQAPTVAVPVVGPAAGEPPPGPSEEEELSDTPATGWDYGSADW